MWREVQRYETKDGQLHTSEEKAKQHIVQEIANSIGPMIDKVHRQGVGLPYKARLTLVDELVGSVEKAQNLKRLLERMLD